VDPDQAKANPSALDHGLVPEHAPGVGEPGPLFSPNLAEVLAHGGGNAAVFSVDGALDPVGYGIANAGRLCEVHAIEGGISVEYLRPAV